MLATHGFFEDFGGKLYILVYISGKPVQLTQDDLIIGGPASRLMVRCGKLGGASNL